MNRLLSRFFKPAYLSQRQALVFSLLAMALIFACDLAFVPAIRLSTLYAIPIVLVGLHAQDLRYLIATIGLSVVFRSVNLYRDDIAWPPLLADIGVALLSASLIGLLARSVRQNQDDAEQLSRTDSLTRLNNRRSFEVFVDLEIQRQRRYGGVFSLVMIDLDKFKELNDSLGHEAGDAALKRVADVLRESLRSSDCIARLGGDEFAVLMPKLARADSDPVCSQLVTAIERSMQEAGYDVTASIGCASFARSPESLAAGLQLADRAMYSAKAKGRNQRVMSEP